MRHQSLWSLVVLFFSLLSVGYAQPAIENVQSASIPLPYTTATIPNLVVSGSNTGVAVCIADESALVISSVVFNGSESLDLIATSSELTMWYLGEATATTADVVITMPSQETLQGMAATAIALSGVSASNPTLTNSALDQATTGVSVNLTTTVDNTMVITCLYGTSNLNTWISHGTGQTERSDLTHPDSLLTGTTTELRATAGLDTFSSTWSGGTGGARRVIAMGIEPHVVSVRRRVKPIILE